MAEQIKIAVLEERIIQVEKNILDKFISLEKSTITAFSSAKEAINKSEIAYDKRFENINEFRKAYEDLITSLKMVISNIPTRQEIENLFSSANKEITSIKKDIDLIRANKSAEFKDDTKWIIGILVVIGLAIISYISFSLRGSR